MLRRHHPGLATVLPVLLAILAVSCAGPAEPVWTPVESIASSQATPPSPQPTAAEEQPLITVGEDERGVLLLLPTRMDELAAEGGLPLLVLLHGNNQTPWVIKGQSGAAVLAEREGVIVALPPGEGNRWRAMFSEVPTESPDLAYVAGLIEQLAATYPVDPDRVYVAGFSMGAVLSGRIACERADLVAAVALDAGSDWGGACVPSRPVSVLVMHGTADTILSMEGVEPFVEHWRDLDSCPGDPDESQLTDNATVWSSTGCADGTAVEFIRIEGASHSWFHDPEAMDTAWEFFTTYQPSR